MEDIKNETNESVEVEQMEEKEENELTVLQEEVEKWKDQCLRSQAELQNYRRRVEKEKQDLIQFGNERYLSRLLVVMDSVEKALLSGEEQSKLYEGVKLIEKSFREFLEKEGVQAIEAEGKPFDPTLHHAVLTGTEEGVEPGIILEELQKGYTLHGRTIRASMVKVSE
ncbi:nucleotide exchange factor GrpE [Guggenheimella bovis]